MHHQIQRVAQPVICRTVPAHHRCDKFLSQSQDLTLKSEVLWLAQKLVASLVCWDCPTDQWLCNHTTSSIFWCFDFTMEHVLRCFLTLAWITGSSMQIWNEADICSSNLPGFILFCMLPPVIQARVRKHRKTCSMVMLHTHFCHFCVFFTAELFLFMVYCWWCFLVNTLLWCIIRLMRKEGEKETYQYVLVLWCIQ